MERYTYLSLIPESLIISMLPPEQFGRYLATGTRKRPHGQAMFFDIDPDFRSDCFDFAGAEARCVPHPDGSPKHSVYLGVYRVLENVPLEAIRDLWLTTMHGRVLRIARGELSAEPAGTYHLYQEMCPVHPLIASCLPPDAFRRFITDPERPISVPKICFVDLELSGMANDPENGSAEGLPYRGLEHIRECLKELTPGGPKQTKTVDRISRQSVLFRCIRSGLFVGDRQAMAYYPYPSRAQMETDYYPWWRCANDDEVLVG